MPLAALAAGAAQRDALVQQNVVTDDSGFTDHHARAVINEEPAPDHRAGVNLDLGEEAADLREDTRQQRDVPAIKFMGEAVRQDGVEPRIAEEDFDDALGRRIFPENGLDLLPDG